MSAPAPTISSRLLDSDDIAQRFSTTRETVYKLVREDGLPAHRIRRRLLFDPDEVDAWVRSRNSAPSQGNDYRAKIKRLVDQAPPITPEQADRIASILGAAR